MGSAEKALVEITARHYDLCFLDIHLPGLTGLKAMEKIRELSPGTRVAIMSGSHLDESMKRRIKENACAFIEKPFDLSQIRKIQRGRQAVQLGEDIANTHRYSLEEVRKRIKS